MSIPAEWRRDYVSDLETIMLRGKIEIRIDEAADRLRTLMAKAKDLSFTLRRISDSLSEPTPERTVNHIQTTLTLLRSEGIDWKNITDTYLNSLWQQIMQADSDLATAKKEKSELLGKVE